MTMWLGRGSGTPLTTSPAGRLRPRLIAAGTLSFLERNATLPEGRKMSAMPISALTKSVRHGRLQIPWSLPVLST